MEGFARSSACTLKVDGWNSLKVRVEAERFLCYLNGELVFEEHDATYKDGKVGLCKFRQTEAEFKGFRLGATLVEPSSFDAWVIPASSRVNSSITLAMRF